MHETDWQGFIYQYCGNRIGGVMLASSVIDRGFKPRSSQTKDYKKKSCCFLAKTAAIRRKNTNWLARNQDNVPHWGDMSIHGLLCQSANTTITHTLNSGFLFKIWYWFYSAGTLYIFFDKDFDSRSTAVYVCCMICSMYNTTTVGFPVVVKFKGSTN